jgi:anti-anti-sigma factor
MAIATVSRSADEARLARSSSETTDPPPHDTSLVILLHGDVEVSTALLLADALAAALTDRVGDVVIDCTDVVFMDLASVRILDAARQLLAREDRTLIFRSPSKYVALVLNLFGLTGLIEPQEASLSTG